MEALEKSNFAAEIMGQETINSVSPWTGEAVEDSDRLMLVTLQDSPYSVREQAEAFLLGGGRVIQYRAKGVAREQMLREANTLVALCADFEATLIVNDFIEIAREVQADGIHLGLDDAPTTRARAALGENAIIGATAHSVKELQALASQPIDYVGLGPFRMTQTKRNLPTPHGAAGTARLVTAARAAGLNVPIFAIGGIDDMDIRDILNAGCMGVAVSASIALASDPQRATIRFLERINRNAR